MPLTSRGLQFGAVFFAGRMCCPELSNSDFRGPKPLDAQHEPVGSSSVVRDSSGVLL